MKPFAWDHRRNAALERERGIGFERIVVAIEHGDLLDVLAHPNVLRYPDQRILVVAVDGYAFLVPFTETDATWQLHTIIPSRKATRDYLDRST